MYRHMSLSNEELAGRNAQSLVSSACFGSLSAPVNHFDDCVLHIVCAMLVKHRDRANKH